VHNKIKRYGDFFTAAIFLCLVFVPAVFFWVLPDNKISEDENRSLQQAPKLSLENLVSGRYTSAMGKYYADQFPLRNALVGAKTLFSYAFFINENKGAVIAKDGYLIQRFDLYSEKTIAEKSSDELGGALTFGENIEHIKNNCGYINAFAENIKNLYPEINLTVAVTPRKIDVMTNRLPKFFPAGRHEKYFEELSRHINKDIYCDLLEALRSKNEEYIYYRTDHHWTTLGALYAYEALGETMGYDTEPLDYFENEVANENFYGTTWSKAGAKWIKPDTLISYRIAGYYNYTTTIHGAGEPKILQGFYDREKLNTKDKYAYFLGGINSHISINDTKIEKREKLLLIADSFGQSLAPFLAMNYDIEIIDTRFFNGNIHDFIEEYNIKNILVLPNMENLSTQNNLVKLTRK